MLSLLANNFSHSRYLKISGIVINQPPQETEPTGYIGDEALDTSGDNIIFFYDFEGGNANDKSGNNNHGTVIGNIFQQNSQMNGEYYATGDGITTDDTTTRITTQNNNNIIIN